MIKFLALFFFGVLFFSSVHAQHKYHFDSKQTGEGNGTKQHPFTSLQKLSELALQPGDSVFFKAGDTLAGNISLRNIKGTKEHNIVFTSYGKSKCSIYGGNGEAFTISASSYFKILNVTLVGAGRKTGNTTNGLGLVNCRNASVKNVDVSGFQKAGFILYNCETYRSKSCVRT